MLEMTGDGLPDLIVTEAIDEVWGLSIYVNQGDGFSEQPYRILEHRDKPYVSTVQYHNWTYDATPHNALTPSTGQRNLAIRLMDLDQNGTQDLVANYSGGNYVRFGLGLRFLDHFQSLSNAALRQTLQGTIEGTGTVGSTALGEAMAVRLDLNGDGVPDLLNMELASDDPQSLTSIRHRKAEKSQKGKSPFQSKLPVTQSTQALKIYLGKFIPDTRPDFAAPAKLLRTIQNSDQGKTTITYAHCNDGSGTVRQGRNPEDGRIYTGGACTVVQSIELDPGFNQTTMKTIYAYEYPKNDTIDWFGRRMRPTFLKRIVYPPGDRIKEVSQFQFHQNPAGLLHSTETYARQSTGDPFQHLVTRTEYTYTGHHLLSPHHPEDIVIYPTLFLATQERSWVCDNQEDRHTCYESQAQHPALSVDTHYQRLVDPDGVPLAYVIDERKTYYTDAQGLEHSRRTHTDFLVQGQEYAIYQNMHYLSEGGPERLAGHARYLYQPLNSSGFDLNHLAYIEDRADGDVRRVQLIRDPQTHLIESILDPRSYRNREDGKPYLKKSFVYNNLRTAISEEQLAYCHHGQCTVTQRARSEVDNSNDAMLRLEGPIVNCGASTGVCDPMASSGVNRVVSTIEFDGFGRPLNRTSVDGFDPLTGAYTRSGISEIRYQDAQSDESMTITTRELVNNGSDNENWVEGVIHVDGFGRVFKTIRKASQPGDMELTTHYIYDARGLNVATLEPSMANPAQQVRYVTLYDELERPIRSLFVAPGSAPQATHQWHYGRFRATSEQLVADGSHAAKQTNHFDPFGRLIEQCDVLTDGSCATTTYTYRADGWSRTDPDGVVTDVTVNGFGEKSRVERAGRIHTFEYDHGGKLVKMTLPCTPELPPTHCEREYEYDAHGRIVHYKPARGHLSDAELIRLGMARFDNAALELGTFYEYDTEPPFVAAEFPNDLKGYYYGLGPSRVISPTTTTEFQYNPLGFVKRSKTTVTYPGPAQGESVVTTYQYDRAGTVIGRESSTTGYEGPQERAVYDRYARLRTVTASGGPVNGEWRVAHYDYDQNGSLIAREHGTADTGLLRERWAYNKYGQA